jgi:hypothetical protein
VNTISDRREALEELGLVSDEFHCGGS